MMTLTTAGQPPERFTTSRYGGRHTHVFRVLFANEPRSYREAIAAVVRDLSPAGAEVFLAEPEELECEVHRLAPDLLICSRMSEALEDRVSSWVELYTGHGPMSRVCIEGKRTTVEGIELPDLLEIVELAEKLAEAANT